MIPNASALPVKPGSAIPHLYYCDPVDGLDHAGHVIKPTSLIDISGQIDRKAEMLAYYTSQREWLRSYHGMDEYIDAMKRHGAMRGRQTGPTYAEAFVQHCGHAFPRNDLLAELLGGKTLLIFMTDRTQQCPGRSAKSPPAGGTTPRWMNRSSKTPW